MKKLFSQFFIFLPLLVSLFFFIPKVYASSYSATVPSSAIDLIPSLPTMKSTVETYISNNSSTYSSDYFIKYNNGFKDVYIFKNTADWNNYTIRYTSSFPLTSIYVNSQCGQFRFNSDFSSLNYLSNCETMIFQTSADRYFILYSSRDLYYLNSDNIFTYNFLDTSYTEPSSDNLKFSTVYDMYNRYYSPPTPSDDTPLLTSFVDLVIEKLTFVCNFFTSSYIYLSIFTIFIFYFVILLLRRLK